MSYIPVLDFYELGRPTLDGLAEKEWVAFDDNDTGMLYLLNGNRYELVNINEIPDNKIAKEIYFESEAACHAAMAEYYYSHNTLYPYMAEWRIAIKKEHGVRIGDYDNDSEPMEFA